MKVAILGVGYVGLVTGVGLALLGNRVTCIDVDHEKIRKLQKGSPTIHETGLESALQMAIEKDRIEFTTEMSAASDADAIFICVGTPSNTDGSIDLTHLRSATKALAAEFKERPAYRVVVVKSTVLPGTTEGLVVPELMASGEPSRDFGICVNPEFLSEGRALEDFMRPDRIIIGETDRRAGDTVQRLYSKIEAPLVRTDIKTAEMIKYASNTFLAARVSLINEIGNVCKLLGIDAYKVAEGVGLDKRIGRLFLRAGCGFGGSCFPKDLSALAAKARELGYPPELLETVLEVNRRQRVLVVDLLRRRLGDLGGKTVAVLGLAFNPNTDDVREGPAIHVIERLLAEGAVVRAYDPVAAENMRKLHPGIEYCQSPQEALKDSDACLVMTDWPEFAELTDADFGRMRSKTIIEGRRILDPTKVTGFEGVCW